MSLSVTLKPYLFFHTFCWKLSLPMNPVWKGVSYWRKMDHGSVPRTFHLVFFFTVNQQGMDLFHQASFPLVSLWCGHISARFFYTFTLYDSLYGHWSENFFFLVQFSLDWIEKRNVMEGNVFPKKYQVGGHFSIVQNKKTAQAVC